MGISFLLRLFLVVAYLYLSIEHHCRSCFSCTVNHEMTWNILDLGTGPDIHLCQETLYHSESCIQENFTVVLQGWSLKFVQHIADPTGVSPSLSGPPGCRLLHFLHHFIVIIGMPNRSRVLELGWGANPMFGIQLP